MDQYTGQRVRDDWWKEDNTQPHGSVFATVEYLDETHDYRRSANLHHMRLYSNRLAIGLSGNDYAIPDSGDKIKLNGTKTVVDAAVAHIATNRPRPMFLTERGAFEQIKKAANLGKYIMGQFYALQQYQLGLDVFRDALIFGTGFQKVTELNGRVHTERVFPDEVLVDDQDARYGKPRNLYQHKQIAREVVAEIWPEHEEAISQAGLVRRGQQDDRSISDPVSVVEAWHLPSGPDATDGRHVVCISTETLVDEPWVLPRFPFAVFRWNPAPLGFYGIGLVEELSSVQIEINYICQKIQRLMTLATSMVWKQRGSGVAKLSNKDWAEREYTGAPPVFQTVQPVAQQYFDHLDRLFARMFEIAGISQMAATSMKPAGLNSGEAIKSYNDIGTQRFMHVGQRWEQFYMDLAEQIIDRAREIDERGDGSLAVLVAGDKDVESIDFKDVSIEQNKYTMKVWPTNLLPDTPTGKLDMVEKLAQVDPSLAPYVVSLLTGIPDIEAAVSRATAPTQLAVQMIDQIIEDGKYEAPDPAMNWEQARQIATQSLLRASKDGVPQARQDLLRQWIEVGDKMQSLAAPPAPEMAPPPPGAGPQPPVPGMGPAPAAPVDQTALPPGLGGGMV